MSTEWGIFNDESADYTTDNAVESQFYSREEAETRLAEIRAEYDDPTNADDDNLEVHEVEEPEECDDDEMESSWSDDDAELA